LKTMISVTIADVPCPKCRVTMSVHICDSHHYLTCMECGYVAAIERDATQRVDIIDYLTGEIKVKAENRVL
jgi:Zn ribbon nucleic-acid-binding protein